jgi:ANTAR domain
MGPRHPAGAHRASRAASRALPKDPVDFHANLIAHLDALTGNLDNGSDLGAIFSVLLDDLTGAVPSLIGLEITVVIGSTPVTVTTMTPVESAQVRASMHFPLTALTEASPGSVVTYYAAAPGAFAELAVDTREALQLDGELQVDWHLSPMSDGPVAGLDELGVINQAVGILMGRYEYGLDEAMHELQLRTQQAGLAVRAAAQQLVDDPRV